MILLDALPLALLGAVLGLDVVSFPQAMISRPLVAATLAGALLGHPGEGLLMGASMELIALETLPFGASRYPEWGSASVVGGAIFAAHAERNPGALGVALLCALATAWVGGISMVWLRRLNARWASRAVAELDAGSARAVVGLQLRGMTADLARGGLLTWLALVVLSPLATLLVRYWELDSQISRAIVVGAAASVAAGAAWKIFHPTHGARWYFLGGLAAGLALLIGR